MIIWKKSFDFAYPVGRVWDAYLEMEGAGGSALPGVGDEFTLTDPAGTRVKITGVDGGSKLQWEDQKPGGDVFTMSATFEATETGARVTITRSGFGEGDAFEIFRESHVLGWTATMHDLALYLATGVKAHRHLAERCALGVQLLTTPDGMRVIDGGPNDLRRDDLLVSINGAAIYGRSDVWFVQRILEPGMPVTFGIVRDGSFIESVGEALPSTQAVVGELGLGPRIEEAV